MTKDQYIEAIEKVCDSYAFGERDHEQALAKLIDLGIDEPEAKAMLAQAIA